MNEPYEMPPVHPAANLFPMMSDSDLQELADDIKANGLQQPIVLFGAQLLDGRNRWKACNLAGVEPRVRDWSGPDPIGHVISLNLRRRHLDESQRAMVAARVATMKQGARSDLSPIGERSQAEAAEMLSVGKRSVERAAQVLEHGTPELAAAVEQGKVAVSTAALFALTSPEEQREVVARGEKEILAAAKELRAKKQEERRSERIERIKVASQGNAPLAMKRRFPVILADPPWQYDDVASRGAAEDHYPTMGVEELCALPVSDQATDDAVLFLWATSALLHDALAVMGAWGFSYRSSAVWTKSRIGLGHWFRIRHEFLLVGVRGELPPPAPADRPDSVIEADLAEHSKKPDKVHELIERMWPELSRLELFARRGRPGWEIWGNQAPKAVAP